MAKSDEKDWSEIFEEARTKAKGDVDALMKDIKPRFEEFVEKAQKAKFHDVAEDVLEAVEKMASELRQKVKTSSSSAAKQKATDTPKKQRRPSYILEDDTPLYRMSPEIKSKHSLTDAQLEKAKEKAALWKPQDGPYK
jgi:vacuolar-type H+-ATPase subunit H